jgi:hypothetical protein
MDMLIAIFSSPETYYSLSTLRGKPISQSTVLDVGNYFPFVNRETQLDLLWERIKAKYDWKRQGNNRGVDAYKLYGAEFVVCCGSSGIGKTTFSTDGLRILAKKLTGESPEKALLQNCVQRNLTFRISFIDNPLQKAEQENPSIILPFRVLYQYLHPTKTGTEYGDFLNTYFELLGKLQLKDVVQYIALRGNVKEQLVVIHIDETQELGVVDGKIPKNTQEKEKQIFYQLVSILWETALSDRSKTHLFPILSGTNALDLYKRFAASSYRYSALDLPLLSQSHMVEIVRSITPKDSPFALEEDSTLAKLMYVATQGHPRLQRSFLSVGSAQFVTEEIPQNAQFSPFYKDSFLRMLENQNNLKLLFPIVSATCTEVTNSQFPEMNHTILATSKRNFSPSYCIRLDAL